MFIDVSQFSKRNSIKRTNFQQPLLKCTLMKLKFLRISIKKKFETVLPLDPRSSTLLSSFPRKSPTPSPIHPRIFHFLCPLPRNIRENFTLKNIRLKKQAEHAHGSTHGIQRIQSDGLDRLTCDFP